MDKTKQIGKKIPLFALLAVLILTMTNQPVQAAAVGDSTTGDTQAVVSFKAGDLKLQAAPALDFGQHEISAAVQVYTAESVGDPVRISDLRGSGEGWSLTVALSKFQLKEDGGDTLAGAVINTSAPTVKTNAENLGKPPVQVTEIELTSDGTVTRVWNAEEKSGMGVWELEWIAGNTTLTVYPGTAEEGDSEAVLTWNLLAKKTLLFRSEESS